MIVFNCFLRMIKRNCGTLILYFSIFLTICISIQLMTEGKGMENFEEERLNIAVIDQDGGTLAKELRAYLGQRHHLVKISDDPKTIQEELFYRNIYYVVTIPMDFERRCLVQGEKLKTVRVPGTTSAFYVDQQINQFLNQVKVLKAAGYPDSEIYQKIETIEQTQPDVTLLDQNGHGGVKAPHAFMFQFMPYIVFSIICYVISYIMIEFRKKPVRRRMICSAMPPIRQNAQLFLGYLVLGIGVWALCMFLPVLLYGKDFLSDANKFLYMANVFALTLVSLAVSFTVGTVVRKPEIVSSVVNVLSLGMSFLCGVFVSMDVLGKGVQTAAQFLPFYWYETVNEMLAMHMNFTSEQWLEIGKGLGIQLLFAAAILCVGTMADQYMTKQ